MNGAENANLNAELPIVLKTVTSANSNTNFKGHGAPLRIEGSKAQTFGVLGQTANVGSKGRNQSKQGSINVVIST